jgi:hypothetical protein
VTVTRKILISSAVALAAAALVIFVPRTSGPKTAALAARERAMELLGQRITELRPGRNILVLSNPFTRKSGYLSERNQYERAGVSGLRKGVAGRATITVVFPEIRQEYFDNPQSIPLPPDTRTPLSFLMDPASVERLAEAHPECGVIVSLIGLPARVDTLTLWNEKDPRSFALLLPDLRLLGAPAVAVGSFQCGKLLAAVIEDIHSGAPRVATRENVVELLEQQPRAFGY